MRLLALGLLVLNMASAFAADEPSSGASDEAAMFGGADAKDSVEGKSSAKPQRDAFASGEVSENPLQIGGEFYQRMTFSGQQGGAWGDVPISAPLQVDGFLDARPNDHLRAYIRPRLLYDSTRNSVSASTSTSSTSAAPSSLFGTTSTIPNNPQVVLDQAWMTFDIDRSVFITAGKQHVKWGASRYWNPTDFLSTQKRDPLLTSDLRLGNSMVKFQIPLEGKGTNLYALALLDNPQPASTLGQLGGAFRAEKVFGNTEIGAEAVFRSGAYPFYGADLSAPIGPFDFYMEAACRSGTNSTYNVASPPYTPGVDLSTLYTTNVTQGPFAQVSGGLNYSFAWRDSRQATLGVEYFYNQLGHDNANEYPVLIFLGQYQPFYTGKNYVAVYANLEGPDEGKRTSYTFSTLGNLSDLSFISRIDFSWRVLTYLTFEAYVDGHYGNQGGEFRFSLNTPLLTNGGTTYPAVNIAAPTMDFGFGLRMSL